MKTDPLRTRCRRCGAALAEPTDNQRSAFCTRGCHRYWYASHCMACEAPKTTSGQYCKKRECRIELAALKRYGVMGKFHQKPAKGPRAPQSEEACSGTPISIGSADAAFPVSPGASVIAGNAAGIDLKLASLAWPDSEHHPVHPGMAASQYEATRRDLRRANPDWEEKQITDHLAAILRPKPAMGTPKVFFGPDQPPLNLIGGYRFAGAPDEVTAATGSLMPLRIKVAIQP